MRLIKVMIPNRMRKQLFLAPLGKFVLSTPLLCTTLLSAPVLTGCLGLGAGTPEILSRIKNHGAVPISISNAHLRGNLVLLDVERKSPIIAKFLEGRGQPNALEVNKELWAPLVLTLFYFPEGEIYRFEQVEDSWLLDGPHHGPKSYRDLGFEREQLGESLQQEYSLLDQQNEDGKRDETLKNGFTSVSSDTQAEAKARANFLSDLEVLRKKYSDRPAEKTPGGDLIHYVIYENETLELLGAWYTKELETAQKLARINRIDSTKKLQIGDQVVIPSYLLRWDQRLPEEALGIRVPK